MVISLKGKVGLIQLTFTDVFRGRGVCLGKIYTAAPQSFSSFSCGNCPACPPACGDIVPISVGSYPLIIWEVILRETVTVNNGDGKMERKTRVFDDLV